MPSNSRTPTTTNTYPSPDQTQIGRGYGPDSHVQMTPTTSTAVQDYGTDTRPTTAQSYETDKRNSYIMDDSQALSRSASRASTAAGDGVSRSNTLKKRSSLSRRSSLKRSSSRKSLRAGSIKGVVAGEDEQDKDYNSAFHTPIPTHGSPTDVLANRFQAWRSFLKSLITYFREIQTSYETRSKAIMKVSNVISNTQAPSIFMSDGGLNDATRYLNDYHKHALSESNKARDIEQDVIQALNGLRADLGAKIKEIKNLNGDFKNSVEKEKEGTKKAIAALDEALQHYDHADGADKGRNDPFIVRLNVDRFIERQIDEENYLHRAYLNLESSGRELESIVVGEIQKAYNAYAGILKREADDAYNTVDLLRTGPISMRKDLEWNQFVNSDPHLVNPNMPLRKVQDIEYPGKYHPAAAEIRAGMLERKSKYLKSYTAGWYVLSPTHLHEFKSADNIYSQPPVMSLYLAEQKLGSHSSPDSGSHKFMLKGRQSGGMHRGHSWVFRAESYDTMMAWFDAVKNLTERTGADKAEYVRKHSRSISGNSARALSISSDGMEEDEADRVPYAASISSQQMVQPMEQSRPQRPQPGGRFPSDLALPRREPVTHSDYSSEPDQETVGSPNINSHLNATRPRTPSQDLPMHDGAYDTNPYALSGVATHESSPAQQRERPSATAKALAGPQYEGNGVAEREDYYGAAPPTRQVAPAQELYQAATPPARPLTPAQDSHQADAVPTQTFVLPLRSEAPVHQFQPVESPSRDLQTSSSHEATEALAVPRSGDNERPNSSYGAWMAPAAAGAAGVGVGAASTNDHLSPKEPTSRFSTSTQPSVLTTDTELTDNSTVPSTGIGSTDATYAKSMSPMTRQNTDFSVSGLHVPGEFPRSTDKITKA
ncbi:Phosphatidylinositol 4,5-bisphosphate-binding protein SLM2 [Sphaceloma murrayae]|uniref:Phosphatidylinositol 4,5-bisphosphate-binding protein SLM2 n=1 Tax=Sphaceloma murrayae TaxID=2082308 RepID=A0A2K1R250_9PEZI|nr:Phosphatidylinositol 4,5-bisphosphate-binding protein SLM2 [Sphaceloma murrayae]